MSQPTTFEEAVRKQTALWRRVETGAVIPGIRFASLREGFAPWGHSLREGHGFNVETGEACTGAFQWDDAGEVLLCQTCFMDGT